MRIQTDRLVIADAAASDIDWIIDLEHDPVNRDFVWQGTRAEHEAEIAAPDDQLLVFRARDDGRRVGYALNHLDRASNRFELRRIVLDEKGRGYGREVIEALLEWAFEHGTNRFWLDVYPDNAAGIRLYESLGFTRDGVLRQNYRCPRRGYLDQIVYSILRDERPGRDPA